MTARKTRDERGTTEEMGHSARLPRAGWAPRSLYRDGRRQFSRCTLHVRARSLARSRETTRGRRAAVGSLRARAKSKERAAKRRDEGHAHLRVHELCHARVSPGWWPRSAPGVYPTPGDRCNAREPESGAHDSAALGRARASPPSGRGFGQRRCAGESSGARCLEAAAFVCRGRQRQTYPVSDERERGRQKKTPEPIELGYTGKRSARRGRTRNGRAGAVGNHRGSFGKLCDPARAGNLSAPRDTSDAVASRRAPPRMYRAWPTNRTPHAGEKARAAAPHPLPRVRRL